MVGTFSKDAESVWKEQVKRRLRNKHSERIRGPQTKLEKLQRQQTALRQEAVNSLSGNSTFDTQLLKSLPEENSVALPETEKQLHDRQNEKETEESRIQYMYAQFSRITARRNEFDTADVKTKKMILTREELLKELKCRKSLTYMVFHSIFIAIFRKGVLLMDWFGFVPTMISANMMDHVRTIVVYDYRKIREE